MSRTQNTYLATFLFTAVIASLIWLGLSSGFEMEPFIAALVSIIALLGHFASQEYRAEKNPKYISVYDRIRRFTSLYKRSLRDRHKFADFGGAGQASVAGMKLVDIYIEPTLTQMPPNQVREGLVPVVTNANPGTETIWDVMSTEAYEHTFVILGPPGCGKSAILQHLTLHLARRWTFFRNPGFRTRLPFLLYLRNHAENIVNLDEYTLEAAIEYSIKEFHEMKPRRNWVARVVGRKGQIICLDGLDEVPISLRGAVVRWVRNILSTHRNLLFVITSRPHGYIQNIIPGAMHLSVNDFDSVQREAFVRKWYVASETIAAGKRQDRAVMIKAEQRAMDLINRINTNKAMSELSVNPLLLIIIATVHRNLRKLPENRVELYDQVCQIFLSSWRQAKSAQMSGPDYSLEQQLRVLRPLAFHLMEKHLRDLPVAQLDDVILLQVREMSLHATPREFLTSIQRNSGIVSERERDRFGFSHLTFQEYLSAEHIYVEGMGEYLEARVTDKWWRETIILYAARSDATALIQACLEAARTNDSTDPMILAIDCLDQAAAIKPSVRSSLLSLLSDRLDDASSDAQMKVLEAFLQRRLTRLVPIRRLGLEVDPDFITNGEYRLFLQSLDDKFQNCPDHWPGIEVKTGAGMNPALGLRSTDAIAFCNWLTKQYSAGGYTYRLPRRNEFADQQSVIRQYMRAEETLGTGYWVQDDLNVVVEFGGIRPHPLELTSLVEQAQEDDRNLATLGLSQERLPETSKARFEEFLANSSEAQSETFSHVRQMRWIDLSFSRRHYHEICSLDTSAATKLTLISIVQITIGATKAIHVIGIEREDYLKERCSKLREEIRDSMDAQQQMLRGTSLKPLGDGTHHKQSTSDMRITHLDADLKETLEMRHRMQSICSKIDELLQQLKEFKDAIEGVSLVPPISISSLDVYEGDAIRLLCESAKQNALDTRVGECEDEWLSWVEDQPHRVLALAVEMLELLPDGSDMRLDLVEATRRFEEVQMNLQTNMRERSVYPLLRMIARQVYILTICAVLEQEPSSSTGDDLLIKTCIERFAELTELERRIDGTSSAVEGLRIVRERMTILADSNNSDGTV